MSNLYGLLSAAGGGGGAAASYWIQSIGNTNADKFEAVAVDSSGNIICVGYTDAFTALVAKFDSAGALLWNKTLVRSGQTFSRAHYVTVDSSDNILVGWYFTYSSDNDAAVCKLDPNGTIVWAKYGFDNVYSNVIAGLAVDSNNDVFVGFNSTYSGVSNTAVITKLLASDGSVAWQIGHPNSGSGYEIMQGLATDSINSVWYVGHTNAGVAGNYDIYVTRISSGGVVLLSKVFGTSSNDFVDYGSISIDDSDNVYVAGTVGGDPALFKLASNGTILWSKYIDYSGTMQDVRVAAISGGGAYLAYTSPVSDNYFMVLCKFSSSGNLEWARRLQAPSTGNEVVGGVAVDANGNPVLVGAQGSTTQGGTDALAAVLPANGSGDGTYGPVTYEFFFVPSTPNVSYSAGNFATGVFTNVAFSFLTPSVTASSATLNETFFYSI